MYGMKTNWCHYFIRILLGLYMFRAHRPIFRGVRTAVHTTIGSVCCVNSCTNSPEDGPVGLKHVETQQYTNKIVTSVGFYSTRWKDARYKKLKICIYIFQPRISQTTYVLCLIYSGLHLWLRDVTSISPHGLHWNNCPYGYPIWTTKFSSRYL